MGRSLWLASCIVAVLGASSVAAAQANATLDRFRPSETPEDDFHLSRPTGLGHLRFAAQLHVDYGLNPLVYETTLGAAGTEAFPIVEHEVVGTLGLAFGLGDRLVIHTGLPVVLLMEGADAATVGPAGVAPADRRGLGDFYLGGRVRLVGEPEDVGALALQATVTFPTSDVPNESSYRGEPLLTVHPELVAELRPGLGSRFVFNVGVRVREESGSADSNLEFRHELTYGLGFAIPLWTDEGDSRTHLDLLAQIYGDSAFALVGEREGTALEATGGLKLFHSSGLVVGAAAGPGLNRGFGSPDLRVIGTLAWMMPAELEGSAPEAGPADRDGDGLSDGRDGCPNEPEDADGFEDEDGCPDPDNDGDGVLDPDDACPDQPETANGHQDEDGCPDALGDSDGDGRNDDVDECPNDPEDADGFEDEDGCPDPDNDGDGVTDDADACRDEAGVVENRGCPDADRDGDGVVDRVDNCPDEVGTVENHGCTARQLVVIEDGRLEILDHVHFRTSRARILPRSYALLRNVARVLDAHPEIARVRVEGHTDARGRHASNVSLSQRRARAVVRFLVDAGVDPGRLEARGYGPDRPVVEGASTPEEHAQNRRVEFNILGGAEGIEQREGRAGADTVDR